MTEQELLRGCQQKDPRAQTALYERYRARLMGLCRRYARNLPEAEDMFQEGFTRIFQQLHTLEQADKFLHWMKRVMVNTAINLYHKNQKQGSETDYEAAWDYGSQEHMDILARISTDELLLLIEELPDGYRLVFNLYVIDGYTHPEIGEMLSISEGTSKSQLARAKLVLQKKLKLRGIVKYENS
ncbi:RNA polymerase sigma factor [Arsenicibacter rosenii]|uniref:RNA polymerase subunit sigma n=1 Tax=Arsenicibacter rosenii TaxID=1750698 RepID=A0A1S2VMT3_9BACT|nr:sigma-70 family RNA polymerase sigma factor [Arsenicibacter rosenii]OIN60081.1 RNA polymerase subunit sigma [Arsenicibacter rosenii]